MDGREHQELLNKVLNSNENGKVGKFIEEINTRIDSTSGSRGPHWHRSDFSHDPRVQGLKVHTCFICAFYFLLIFLF